MPVPHKKRPPGLGGRSDHVFSDGDDFPGAPEQEQRHNGVDKFVIPAVQRVQQRAQRGPDQVSGGGAGSHDDREAQHGWHRIPMRQDITGIGGDPQHQDVDVQELQEEAVHIGQRLAGGAGLLLGAGAAHQRAVGQIEDISRAHILGHGDNLRHQLSQPGTAEAAQQHNGDQSRPDPKNQRPALPDAVPAGAAEQQNVVGPRGKGGCTGIRRQL